MQHSSPPALHRGARIAVVGSGISGLSAAWLLSKSYDVVLFESEPRPGGHSNTVVVPAATPTAPPVAVDTGFIVYNTGSYPNLVALFEHLGVATAPTDMSFAVSLDGGGYEYAGTSLATLFAQASNLVNPSHWRMLADTLRFYRDAARLAGSEDETLSLGTYLEANRYSRSFIDRHILPMAAAIWSTPSAQVMAFPVASFVRFFANHGLLQVRDRPIWRTVVGGSRNYVERMLGDMRGSVRLSQPALSVRRLDDAVRIVTAQAVETFDACVIATHADTALALIGDDADGNERDLLGAFRYQTNQAVLHRDASLMPRRRRVWSSWNYLGSSGSLAADERDLSLTYWMNCLQPLGPDAGNLFVTLNPHRQIRDDAKLAEFDYAHPMFDARAMAAQRRLWELQGTRRTWFCGSYFGYGFHEDGLQAGLAAAEDIGGVARPWHVNEPSGRIHLTPPLGAATAASQALREAAE